MRAVPRPAMALLALGGVALLAVWAWWPRQRAAPVPELALDGLQPEVARKIEGLRRRLLAEPDSAPRWGWLAVNLDVHDLRKESIPFYARAAELDPRDVRWPYYGAIALESMGSDDALAWFERARELAPDYPAVHVRYGRALLDRNRWDDAAAAFRSALEAAPGTSDAHLGMAQVALLQGDLESSRQHLLLALDAVPDHGEAHGLLAEVYRRLGRPEDARRELLRARESPAETPVADPLLAPWSAEGSSVYWHTRRGHDALDRGDFEEAARELELALAAQPDAKESNNLGLALRRLGRPAEAEARFRAAAALDPSFAEALMNLGTTLAELGRRDEAIASVEQALAVEPAFAEGYASLGTLYSAAGRYGEAAAVLRRGLDQAPDDLRIALRLALILATAPSAAVRDGAEAVRLAGKVCEATGYRNAEALDVLAAAYAETGMFVRAVETAESAYEHALAKRRTELAEQIGGRLASYKQGRPYRQPAP